MLNAKPDNKMLTENQGVAPTWWLQLRNNKKCSLKIREPLRHGGSSSATTRNVH